MINQQTIHIVSGGQTGVDRSALDTAISLAYTYGGWCPKDGLAEDYPQAPGLLKHYPSLKETSTKNYLERTELNVYDSDATLILASNDHLANTGGTGKTQTFAKQYQKPCLVFLTQTSHRLIIKPWLERLMQNHSGKLVLNVAGPRASKDKDIYLISKAILSILLQA